MAESSGGPRVPDDVRACRRGFDIWYWGNDFKVSRGMGSLTFWKLNEGSGATQCSCRRCQSIVMVDHAIYLGRSIAVPADSAEAEACSGLPVRLRWHTDDLPAGKLATLPRLPCLNTLELWNPTFWSFMWAILQPLGSRWRRGTTFQALCRESGGVHIHGITYHQLRAYESPAPEPERSAPRRM